MTKNTVPDKLAAKSTQIEAIEPKWRDEYTVIAKQFEKDLSSTPVSERITYPSYSSYIEALRGKTS